MSLLDVLRSGVAVADRVTKPLQATVSYERYLYSDEYGEKTYGPAVPMAAIVDWVQRQVRTKEGVLSVCRASVLFLDIQALLAATVGTDNPMGGISDEDRIILPDGDTGPILDMSGFIDAGTGIPVATTVFLG